MYYQFNDEQLIILFVAKKHDCKNEKKTKQEISGMYVFKREEKYCFEYAADFFAQY